MDGGKMAQMRDFYALKGDDGYARSDWHYYQLLEFIYETMKNDLSARIVKLEEGRTDGHETGGYAITPDDPGDLWCVVVRPR